MKKYLVALIDGDREGLPTIGLKAILLVLGTLSDDGDSLGHQENGVETHAGLTDLLDILTQRHESLSILTDSVHVLNKLGPQHAYPLVLNS